jgi:hypothetical protein
MCSPNSPFPHQRACICRAKKGAEAYDQITAMAPNLSKDWEESVGWRALSEEVTGKPVVCGRCEDWWVHATREIVGTLPGISP